MSRQHENKKLMAAMQELRRSNAATRHVLAKHKGSRGAKKRAAINEQAGAHRGRLPVTLPTRSAPKATSGCTVGTL